MCYTGGGDGVIHIGPKLCSDLLFCGTGIPSCVHQEDLKVCCLTPLSQLQAPPSYCALLEVKLWEMLHKDNIHFMGL